jgi:hypothetical protein
VVIDRRSGWSQASTPDGQPHGPRRP